jgi:hypothetical protein
MSGMKTSTNPMTDTSRIGRFGRRLCKSGEIGITAF